MTRTVIRPPPARGRPRSAKRGGGFTLIEVVVAFVMLALVLGTAYQIFAGGITRAADLDDYSRALLVAQSKIAETGLEGKYAEGQTEGDTEDRRFHWTVAVAQSAEGAGSPDRPSSPYVLYRVDVRVVWRGTDAKPHALALATLGLGSRP